ncbi:hypothetical protein PHLGIDRAFT_517119 [Phlebiopsis gigantea 11061_1 CR5-6]|uniref:DUF4110 domain-containing protein n=1 Tax=Phlebiopsis gigantea (strain 11061_1 CR5-6) TaxID=745531 RepID=A0A0C3NLN6_PHLG1|nr:hypothetical protein PHLGIDRAFT_517119 [Phlebiopsis gigantea 11061_1 CR5-6]
MAKKKATKPEGKGVAKAAKKEKAAKKLDQKEKKKAGKSKDKDDDDQDLETILEEMRQNWEHQHKVTEELVEGPPSRRANASLTPCPNGNHLWCIGGEFFSEDNKAHFYNDVFRYSPEKDEWRKFVSPTCPGPRSAHAVVASPVSGGKLFLFGGEFSSLNQATFHHYRDFWCFDIATHSWDRIETKGMPSARSGHRMAMWKHYVVLFGGFYDPGIRTKYLDDLWLFDTQEYKWKQAEFKLNERRPSPRSGFSFLPTADGIILHGGYCKEYSNGKRPVGVMLDDTWFLQMSMPTAADLNPSSSSAFLLPILKWEKRKKSTTAFAPSLRSGCTMSLWQAKNMGILFGGVTDEDTSEETLESIFHNDLYGYQIAGNGRWLSLSLKRPKQQAGRQKKRREKHSKSKRKNNKTKKTKDTKDEHLSAASAMPPILNPDDPNLTVPLPRYNAMSAVLRNTLYIYGGIFEKGSREYTLDDFHYLMLDKLDKFVCLKPTDVVIPTESDESSSDDSDGSNDSNDSNSGSHQNASEDNESPFKMNLGTSTKQLKKLLLNDKAKAATDEEQVAEEVEGGKVGKAAEEEEVASVEESLDKVCVNSAILAFMGVAKDATNSAEDVLSTPLPGETLAMFHTRSKEYWKQKAHHATGNLGKTLRTDAFKLARSRYVDEYKPKLQELEKILTDAGVGQEEMRQTAAAGPDAKAGQSRNRR